MIIEFVKPPRASRGAWRVAVGLWLLVALLAGVNLVLKTRGERAQASLRAADESARARAAAPPMHQVPAYHDEGVQALQRATLPDAAALAELEHVAVKGIRVNAIEDDPHAATVTVELEASSHAVLADYIDQLNAGLPSPRWHMRLVSAQNVTARDARTRMDTAAGGDEIAASRATIYRDIQVGPR